MVKNYKELLYDSKPLETKDLILREFEKSDAPAVLGYGSDEDVLKHLIWSGVTDMEEAVGHIIERCWIFPGSYAIELKEEGVCIGSIGIDVEPEHEKASFGYVICKEHWGKGYVAQGLDALIGLCFKKLELNRVEACHFVGNEASGRVLEKAGMIKEGIGRAEMKIKGEFRDVVHYGLTCKQWENDGF